MLDPLSIVEGFLARLRGPMNLRFVLQPLMAALFALRDGRRDARVGNMPFVRALFINPEHRRGLLLSCCKSIGKVFVAAVALDIGFQYIVFHGFHMRGGALVAGVLLAVVPYVLLRGPANHMMQRKAKAAGRGRNG